MNKTKSVQNTNISHKTNSCNANTNRKIISTITKQSLESI